MSSKETTLHPINNEKLTITGVSTAFNTEHSLTPNKHCTSGFYDKSKVNILSILHMV